MTEYNSKETNQWLKENINEFSNFLKKWITRGDSKFTDIIYQEMQKSMTTKIIPPLFSSLLMIAKDFHDRDGLSVYDSLSKVFNSCDEVYRIGMKNDIGT